eukprot:Pgem_evm1s11666
MGHNYGNYNGMFKRWSVDICGKYTTTKKSRWSEGFCTPNIDANTIANLFINKIFLRYGPCESIISDRGQNFLNDL